MHPSHFLTTCLSLDPDSQSNLNTFHIAPMQCYTNAPLRKLFHLLSPSSIKWTEMEKVDDLFPKPTKPHHHHTSSYPTITPITHLQNALEKRLGPPQEFNEPNLILQLGSNDPHRLQSCLQHTVQHYSLKGININCGCPSIESGGAATFGASLMKDASLTGRLVESMRRGLDCGRADAGGGVGETSVSVKCRIAVFDHVDEMHYPLQESDYRKLRDYVSTVRDAGANGVILHARPVILSGISPVKNRIVPQLNYGFVERIAADFPEMDITLNGGIQKLSDLDLLEEQHRSVMAGRWCLRRPLDLVGVEALLKKNVGRIESKLALGAVEGYVDYVMKKVISTKQQYTMSDLCLPLFLVVAQLKCDYEYDYEHEINIENTQDSSQLDKPILSYDEMESLYDVIQDCLNQLESLSKNGGRKKKQGNLDEINFKRLSSSFKSLVGTKVVNKWKRNRSEL